MLYFYTSYLGWDIPVSALSDFRTLIDEEVPSEAQAECVRRYGKGVGAYHITLVTPPEVRKLRERCELRGETLVFAQCLFKHFTKVDGSPTIRPWLETEYYEDVNGVHWRTYYLPVEWPSAAGLRSTLQLPPKKFHISVGFSKLIERARDVEV